jgi:hypothetical protein
MILKGRHSYLQVPPVRISGEAASASEKVRAKPVLDGPRMIQAAFREMMDAIASAEESHPEGTASTESRAETAPAAAAPAAGSGGDAGSPRPVDGKSVPVPHEPRRRPRIRVSTAEIRQALEAALPEAAAGSQLLVGPGGRSTDTFVVFYDHELKCLERSRQHPDGIRWVPAGLIGDGSGSDGAN